MRPDRILGRSYETLSFGLVAAGHLLEREPGSPPVLGGLERAGAALDKVGLAEAERRSGGGSRLCSRATRRAGCSTSPCSTGGTAGAEPVADALRRHAQEWDDAQQLVALLAAATGTRPTNEWRRRSRVLASSYGGYGELLRGLLEPLLWIEPVSSGVPRPPIWLVLAPGNETLVRGAVWAVADVDEARVVPLLGRLALRSAAPSPHPKVTTALCHPAASGAIEALAAIGGPDAHAELRRLLPRCGDATW